MKNCGRAAVESLSPIIPCLYLGGSPGSLGGRPFRAAYFEISDHYGINVGDIFVSGS